MSEANPYLPIFQACLEAGAVRGEFPLRALSKASSFIFSVCSERVQLIEDGKVYFNSGLFLVLHDAFPLSYLIVRS